MHEICKGHVRCVSTEEQKDAPEEHSVVSLIYICIHSHGSVKLKISMIFFIWKYRAALRCHLRTE